MSYRNIYYDRKSSVIHHFGYNDEGEPIKREVFFKPYLYLPAATKDEYHIKGIDGQPLVKKEFNNEWERNKFATSARSKVYFNLPATQQYLLEQYHHLDIQELTKYALRTFFFDIEVIADEFPDAKEAKFPITSITIYDSYTKKYYVWGVKMYDHWSCKDHLQGIEPEEIVYEYCLSEHALMKKFLAFWRKNFPDLIVGYNSFSFDIPYIVHRIEKLFGEGKSSKLSPVDNIYGREVENKKFGTVYTEYTIGGVSHLDYMILYKYMTAGENESDSLEYVCQDELGCGKLDYGSMSLHDLYHKDWNRFINYNIWDVRLLVLLDQKKKYLDIAKFSAFSGFCNLNKALGKEALLTGAIAKQALMEGTIISTQEGHRDGNYEKIAGGYVKHMLPGMYDNIISVDANSLYPSAIITLNISPETKRAKIIKRDDTTVTIFKYSTNQTIELPVEKFDALISKYGYAVASSGVIFDQSQKSLCSKFCDNLYQKRKDVKQKMLALKAALAGDTTTDAYKSAKFLADQLDTEQYLYKILLNSMYGVLASPFFALHDRECAESVTLTGQAMIKKSEEIILSYIEKEWELEPKDRCVAIDTDSVMFCFTDIMEKEKFKIVDANGNLTPEMVSVEERVCDHLNREIKQWAEEVLHTKDSRFEFKRENIVPRAIWTKPKNYIMYIVNSEGVKMDYIKYKGLSVVRSTFSEETKNITKSIVKSIMTSVSKADADAMYFEHYESFSKLPDKAIATRASMKSYDAWAPRCKNINEMALGMPFNAKNSYNFNYLLKEHKLENKYPAIKNGNKIKVVYLKQNRYNIKAIAYLDELPPDFDLHADKELMFEKCVINCLRPIYAALQWKVPNPKIQYATTFDDLFS